MIDGVAALPRNAEVAEQFDLLADLLELEGAESFRVLAYRRAAARMRDTSGSIAQLALDGRAKELQGIGKTIEEKIVQIVEQGEIALSSGTRKVATETADQIRSTTGATGARVATTTKAAVSIGQAIALRPSTAPPPQAAVPTVPQNVSATAVVGSIKLAWSTPSSDGGAPITNYRIYRGTTSGGESLLTTVGNTTNYVDSAVTTGSSYFYRVAAVNSVGEGPQSAEVSAAPITVTVPGPPQNLTAAAAKPRGVGMSWSAPASNGGSTITGYRVYRSTASGQETLLTTVGVVTSYTDTLTTSGVRYYYKVLAFSSAGDGALSNEATAIAR